MEEPERSRYFMVNYSWVGDAGQGLGIKTFATPLNYLIKKKVIKSIKESILKTTLQTEDSIQVCFSSIIELNEDDYNDWIR